MRPYGPAALRLVVGIVVVAHGAQRLFGVWGAGGIAGKAASLVQLDFAPAYLRTGKV